MLDRDVGNYSVFAGRWFVAPNLPEVYAAHIAASDPAQTLADLDAQDRAGRIEAAARDLLVPWFRDVSPQTDALCRALDGEV